MAGRLFLIPTTMGEANAELVIPAGVLQRSRKLKHFIAENERTARRYLKAIGTEIPLDDLVFHILNKHTEVAEIPNLTAPLTKGIDMGLISEAGLPAIADPGASVVAYCHRNRIQVVPASGPSSILLALTASGFNGQEFHFHGYLPIERKERSMRLKKLEADLRRDGATQIFMETPFRNDKLLEQILETCSPATELCIATDISLTTEKIKTTNLATWQKHRPKIHKRPCIFLLGISA